MDDYNECRRQLRVLQQLVFDDKNNNESEPESTQSSGSETGMIHQCQPLETLLSKKIKLLESENYSNTRRLEELDKTHQDICIKYNKMVCRL